MEDVVRSEVAEVSDKIEAAIEDIKASITELGEELEEKVASWRGGSTVDEEPALPPE